MNDHSEMTDAQRVIVIEAVYSGMADYQRAMHRAVRETLDAGTPMDQVVELAARLIVDGSRSHGHPVDRAAAILWSLDRLPRWVYTPVDESVPPAAPVVPLPGLGVPWDVIREAVWQAMDAETDYHAEMHARVRHVMTLTTPNDAYERLMASAVEAARAKYDHFAGRAAEVGWHAMMIPKWMSEPAEGEN